ncbi:MAG TPA: cbb3-type cytochrome c oxidase subunit 3 [Hyphomicrobiales bacterium]|nr:cbb3-type cytochrome c oxidase subunit 3 [Hyphomicrobiales bacterium]
MAYEEVRGIAGIAGMLLFIILFAGVLIYTFWPGNRKRFEHARYIPLENDPDADSRLWNQAEDESISRGENGR